MVHPPALVLLCTRCMHSTLLLLPASQMWAVVGFQSFCPLFFIICSNCTRMQLFFVPYSFFFFFFFVFCIFLLNEMFVQVQALQQRVPGPRSQIPGPSLPYYQKHKLINTKDMQKFNFRVFPFCNTSAIETLKFSWVY